MIYLQGIAGYLVSLSTIAIITYIITEIINYVNFKYRRDYLMFMKFLNEEESDISDDECQQVLMEDQDAKV